LPKENEPKEKAAVHLVPLSGTILCCSQKTDASESRTPCGVLRRGIFQLFPPLLGCVKWHNKIISSSKELYFEDMIVNSTVRKY